MCRVWSVECRVWSEECKVQSVECARPYGDRADGCERLRTVADADATSSEHTLNPQTPRVKREPCYAFGKTSISYETSSNFHSLKHAKKTCFAASAIDTATPPENQRHETRRVGAPKRAFPARLLPIFALCRFKIDVFLRVFLGTSKFATSKSMFRARLPSIFSTSHKMPRLPRNLHLVAT